MKIKSSLIKYNINAMYIIRRVKIKLTNKFQIAFVIWCRKYNSSIHSWIKGI